MTKFELDDISGPDSRTSSHVLLTDLSNEVITVNGKHFYPNRRVGLNHLNGMPLIDLKEGRRRGLKRRAFEVGGHRKTIPQEQVNGDCQPFTIVALIPRMRDIRSLSAGVRYRGLGGILEYHPGSFFSDHDTGPIRVTGGEGGHY